MSTNSFSRQSFANLMRSTEHSSIKWKIALPQWADMAVFKVETVLRKPNPFEPDRPMMEIDQGVFLHTAAIQFYECDGQVRFRGSPYVALVKAFHRLFEAWILTVWIEREARKRDILTKYVAPKTISLIRNVHVAQPLALASGPAIRRFDYWRQIEEKLFKKEV